MSRALPCGRFGMMSTSTTSAKSRRAISCAHVAPTLPAPTTVTFALDKRPAPEQVPLARRETRALQGRAYPEGTCATEDAARRFGAALRRRDAKEWVAKQLARPACR